MPAKLERVLTRLLLIIIATDALTLAARYQGAAQVSLCLLAVVAAAGLGTPILTLREEEDGGRSPR
jgi:hypothetical protein